MIDKKQCKALKYNKQQCTRDAKGNSKYCWQHRFSRFSDARWYNNAKIQVGIGLASILATIIIGLYPIAFGPTKSNQETIINQNDLQKIAIEENHSQTQEKLDELLKRSNPGIPEETRRAVENVFMDILKEKAIPEWQWAEKLQEVAKRHQNLLDKWQMVQSGDSAVDDLRDKAHRMIEIGDYDKAHQLLQEAIEINRKAIQSQQETLDKRKLSTAQSLADQARIAETRLDHKKAIALFKDALNALPHNEQETRPVYMYNLGFLYYTIADYKEAEMLFEQSLAIAEATFGPENPAVAIHLNGLAALYQATNRLKEAEPLMKRALVIGEASFGPEHPDVALYLNNLAMLYQATTRLKEAEPLMQRVVEIFEKSLGEKHPDVATALNNLATLYENTNRLKEAETLMKRALAIDEASFGSEHPEVARDLNNLARLYQDTNRLKEAETLMKRGLQIGEKFNGPKHPHVAIQLNNLAQLYQDTNRLKEAEPLMKRALAIDEASFGPEHPTVATDLNNLAGLYSNTNRLAEAEPLIKRVVEIFLQFTRRTGHPHPDLEAAINNYGNLLIQMGHTRDEVNNRLKRLAPEIFDIDG